MKNQEAKLHILGEAYIKFNFEYSEISKSRIKRAYLEQIGLKSHDFQSDSKRLYNPDFNYGEFAIIKSQADLKMEL